MSDMQVKAPSGGSGEPEQNASREWSSLCNWALVWIILFNGPGLIFWYIGGPLRAPEIVAAATVGILVRKASFSVRLLTFVSLLGLSVISMITQLFMLPIDNLLSSWKLLETMNPASSLEYLLATAMIVAIIALAVPLLKRDGTFRSGSMLLIAAFGSVFFAATDTAAKWHSRGSYERKTPDGVMFESGVARSGILQAANNRRHMIIVVVEALGQPLNSSHAELLMEPWSDPQLRSRYLVQHGTTRYFGSTTNGEIRELCARWGNYDTVLRHHDPACLPHKLRQAGYATTAIHSFSGEFFQRKDWYPNIGFQRTLFSEDLQLLGAGFCEGVFPGACDADVPKIIARHLKTASNPQLLYWLTLNSHLPVMPQDGRCHEYSPELAKEARMTCRVFRVYDNVARALITEIIEDDFPAADILVVGDHMPPFFDYWNRSKFDSEHVPWIMLRRREDSVGQPAAANSD